MVAIGGCGLAESADAGTFHFVESVDGVEGLEHVLVLEFDEFVEFSVILDQMGRYLCFNVFFHHI